MPNEDYMKDYKPESELGKEEPCIRMLLKQARSTIKVVNGKPEIENMPEGRHRFKFSKQLTGSGNTYWDVFYNNRRHKVAVISSDHKGNLKALEVYYWGYEYKENNIFDIRS